ncbi:MAG: flagellar export protein FliJ [Treponema sp.]|nr:flagellar export protein FliJ [Treponema sp.]
MKAFSFGLQKVLNLRKYYEDEAKIELGRAVGVLSEIEARIRQVAVERARAAEAQFSPKNNAAIIQQYMYYLLRLDSTREQLLEDAALAEIKVEEARELFMEASRERKIFDKLKEKRQKEYRKNMFNEETKILDDISSHR